MKSWLVGATLLICFAVCAQKGPTLGVTPVTLAWNAEPAPWTNCSYAVFCGTNSGQYMTNQVVTNTTATWALAPGITYFFACQATNVSGVALLSQEITWTQLPTVTGLRVIIVTSP